MERSSSLLAGVEECKGPIEGSSTLPLPDEKQRDKRNAVTLYVTVHSGGDSKIVPFYISPAGNMAEVRALSNAQCGDVLIVPRVMYF